MDDGLLNLLRRLMKVPWWRGIDRVSTHIFEFYEMMREDPALPPEAFLSRFPASQTHYPVVLLFARALERNRNEIRNDPAPLLGETLGNGHFRILYRIGNGGMGEVYAAAQANALNRNALIAIKTIHTRTYAGAERDPVALANLRERIVEEAHYLERVSNHENVVQFVHAGYDPPPTDLVYIVTRFIEGRSLAELVEGRFPEPLPQPEVLWIIREACKGLIAIHGAPPPPTVTHGLPGPEFLVISSGGLIHRDVKPSNILLDRGGSVKLIDLGLAGPSGTTILNGGTKGFMAPEQDPRKLAGKPGIELDGRVDVYSLGKTFFSLLARIPTPPDELPNRGDRIWDGIPPAYMDVILKATASKPEERHAGSREFLHALDGLGDAARPDESRKRVRQLLEEEDREVNIWVAQDLARRRNPTQGSTTPQHIDPRTRRSGITRRWLLAAGAIMIAAALLGWRSVTQPGRLRLENLNFYLRQDGDDKRIYQWDVESPEGRIDKFLRPEQDDLKLTGRFNQKTNWFIFWHDTNGKWSCPLESDGSSAEVSYPRAGDGIVIIPRTDPPGTHVLYLLAGELSRNDLESFLKNPPVNTPPSNAIGQKVGLLRSGVTTKKGRSMPTDQDYFQAVNKRLPAGITSVHYLTFVVKE